MKRSMFVGLLGAAAALVMGVAPVNAQALKVGFVNTQRVLAETPGVAAANQSFQNELTRLRAPLDSLEQRLNAAGQQFQQQQATLSPQAREARQTELQQQYAAYQQRGQQIQEQATARQQQLIAPVMQQINAAIEAVRREGAFTFIIDSSQPGIVAVDPALDLTDRVVARVRGGAAPAPARP